MNKSLLKGKLVVLKKSIFWKELIVLSSGNGISQLIYLLSLPFISRFFGVEEFGRLGLFQATIGIWSVIVSFRLCGAIPIPNSTQKGDNLFWTSVISTFVVGIFFYIASYFLLNNSNHIWKLMLFVVLVASSLLEIFEYYLLRVGKVRTISKQILLRVILIIIGQFIMFFSNHSERLVLGYVLGITIHIIFFSIIFFKQNKPVFIGPKILFSTVKEYKEFVIYQTPTVLFNSLVSNLPFLIVNHFFGKEVLGLFTMANKILLQPFQLIGTSLRRVFLKNAAKISNKEERRIFLKKITNKLNIYILPLLLLFVLVSPYIMPIILGKNWDGIGQLMLILFIGVYTGLINQTIQAKVEIERLQQKYLIFTIISQVILLFVMFIAGYIVQNYLLFFISISIFTGIINLIKYYHFQKI